MTISFIGHLYIQTIYKHGILTFFALVIVFVNKFLNKNCAKLYLSESDFIMLSLQHKLLFRSNLQTLQFDKLSVLIYDVMM